MKKLTRTKVIVISILLSAFFLTVVLLGINITQNLATSDSSASTEPKCIGFDYNDNSYCASKSADTTKACNDPSFRMAKSGRTKCCTFNDSTNTCSKISQNEPRLVSACDGFQCTGSSRFLCLGGSETIMLDVCTDNFKFQYPTTPLNPGTKREFEGCSIPVAGGPSDCLSGLYCCPCSSGYKCGGKTKSCTDVCAVNGGSVDPGITPAAGGGSTSSTPSCTPVYPAAAKLTSPRSRSEIIESKVTISWEKNGTFGKECKDNGKKDRFILKYAVINPSNPCPSIGSKYKGRQLTVRTPGQKKYSVELSDLKNNKKYCWFVRTKNGETRTDTKVRSFTTNITVPVVDDGSEEDLKVIEGDTTIEAVNETE